MPAVNRKPHSVASTSSTVQHQHDGRRELAEVDRRARRRRQQQRSDRLPLALAIEGAAQPDGARDDDRDPEDAGGHRRRRLGVADDEGEAEDQHHHDGQERHRVEDLAAAPLDAQILGRDAQHLRQERRGGGAGAGAGGAGPAPARRRGASATRPLLVDRAHGGGVEAGGARLVEGDPPAPQHDQVVGDRARGVEIVGDQHDDAPGGALGAPARAPASRRPPDPAPTPARRTAAALARAAARAPAPAAAACRARTCARRPRAARRPGPRAPASPSRARPAAPGRTARRTAPGSAPRSGRRTCPARARRSRSRRAPSSCGAVATSPQRSSPVVGATSVDRMPSSVLLPAPLGPTIAVTCPAPSSALTSTSARRPP